MPRFSEWVWMSLNLEPKCGCANPDRSRCSSHRPPPSLTSSHVLALLLPPKRRHVTEADYDVGGPQHHVQMELLLWASYRGQLLARTVR